MQIFVQHKTQTFVLYVTADDTIDAVKAQIQQELGIPSEQQRLVLETNGSATRELRGGSCTLAGLGVLNESMVQLVQAEDVDDAVSQLGSSTDLGMWQCTDHSSMRIFVKTMTKTIVLDVAADSTIDAVKALIQQKEGVHPEHQRLILEMDGSATRELHDGPCTLAGFGVQNESTVQLVQPLKPAPLDGKTDHSKMQIYITNMSKTIVLDVAPDETINAVKAMIQQKEGIPPEEQQLILEIDGSLTRELHAGSCTLAGFGVQNESTLHLIPLKGDSNTQEGEPKRCDVKCQLM